MNSTGRIRCLRVNDSGSRNNDRSQSNLQFAHINSEPTESAPQGQHGAVQNHDATGLRDLPYDEGVDKNRRQDGTRHVSIGIWLIPIEVNQSPSNVDTSHALPAVTCDMRRQGIGVLVPTNMQARRFMVAVADQNEVWRFFLTEVRHVSSRPGSWHQLGLDVVKTIDLESLQLLDFRNRVNSFAGL